MNGFYQVKQTNFHILKIIYIYQGAYLPLVLSSLQLTFPSKLCIMQFYTEIRTGITCPIHLLAFILQFQQVDSSFIMARFKASVSCSNHHLHLNHEAQFLLRQSFNILTSIPKTLKFFDQYFE